jgi:hypothetical protein
MIPGKSGSFTVEVQYEKDFFVTVVMLFFIKLHHDRQTIR